MSLPVLLAEAKDLAAEHADQVKEGIEKAQDFTDKQTEGKQTVQIHRADGHAVN